MNLQEKQLWGKLKQYPLHIVDTLFPFYARLMQENNWDKGYTLKAITEYKKFMFLWSVAGVPLCAPAPIRKVWQLHLMYTHSYWREFCRGIFGKPIHHSLTSGSESNYEEEAAVYSQLTKVYQQYFDMPPPRPIWLEAEATTTKTYREETEVVETESTSIWHLLYYLQGLIPKTKGRWFIASFISLFVVLSQPDDLDYKTGIAFIVVVLMIIGIAMAAIKSDKL
ncbi:hypothetical protein BKI52_24645 [marine bacterium AO1-C]|nr:hypothetical protein BKI52_24645 [marine bacterium AO1-C]